MLNTSARGESEESGGAEFAFVADNVGFAGTFASVVIASHVSGSIIVTVASCKITIRIMYWIQSFKRITFAVGKSEEANFALVAFQAGNVGPARAFASDIIASVIHGSLGITNAFVTIRISKVTCSALFAIVTADIFSFAVAMTGIGVAEVVFRSFGGTHTGLAVGESVVL